MGANKISNEQLTEMQSWNLEQKENNSLSKIYEFCKMNDNNVSVAFSGGADSTVLLDLVCRVWSNVLHNPCPLSVIYSNTSNEFSEMPIHVRNVISFMRDKYGVDIDYKEVKSNKTFIDVVKTYGYPIASKKVAKMIEYTKEHLDKLGTSYSDIKDHLDNGIESAEYLRELGFPDYVVAYLTGITKSNTQTASWKIPKRWRTLLEAPFKTTFKCCDILKKEPMKLVQKETDKGIFVGTMASDSQERRSAYQKTSCILFTSKNKKCMPMGFWLEQDKIKYLAIHNLPLAYVYGNIEQNEDGEYHFTGEQHTGCKLCLFGCQFDKGKNRIQRLKDIEPATYNFAMKPIENGGLGYKEVMEYIGLDI